MCVDYPCQGGRQRERGCNNQTKNLKKWKVSQSFKSTLCLIMFLFFGLENNKTVKRGLELATKEIIDCVEEETIKKYGKNNFCL